MTHPNIINTKGERKALEEDELDVSNLIEYYRNTALGHYEWGGAPIIMDDMPIGFIEDTLFCYGNISAKKVKGLGWRVMATKPETIDMYGQPYTWLPETIAGRDVDKIGLMNPSKEPVLDLGVPMSEQIFPYLVIMGRALKVLDINIMDLSQPVLVEGLSGTLEGAMREMDVKCGKRTIPCVKKESIGIEVLDLKAQDHTQNLASTIMFCHSKIMDLLDIPNSNIKSSGVSDMETSNANAGLSTYNDWGLKKRKQWCDRMNKLHPELELTVKVSGAWDVPEGSPAEEKKDEEVIEDAEIDS